MVAAIEPGWQTWLPRPLALPDCSTISVHEHIILVDLTNQSMWAHPRKATQRPLRRGFLDILAAAAVGGPTRLRGALMLEVHDICTENANLLPVIRNCRFSRAGEVVWPSLRQDASQVFDKTNEVLSSPAVPWHLRLPSAVWRGGRTGADRYGTSNADRLGFVEQFRGREHFNVEFVDGAQNVSRGSHPPPPAAFMAPAQQAEHKMIIALPGNGAASAMAWVFQSGSAVLLPYPIHEDTWLLSAAQPWVHFVPLARNLSDVEERVRWCLTDSDVCERIAAAGKRLIAPYWPGGEDALRREASPPNKARLRRLQQEFEAKLRLAEWHVLDELLRQMRNAKCDLLQIAMRSGWTQRPLTRDDADELARLVADAALRDACRDAETKAREGALEAKRARALISSALDVHSKKAGKRAAAEARAARERLRGPKTKRT
jgi:hypothetical protein